MSQFGAIEASFTGRIAWEPTKGKTKTGKPWLRFHVLIGSGNATQRVQVSLFGSTVAELAPTLTKGATDAETAGTSQPRKGRLCQAD